METSSKEQMRAAWHASGMKTVSFHPYDMAYENQCFERWYDSQHPPKAAGVTVEAESKTRWVVQYQINDPGYQYCGEWFDMHKKDTEAEGKEFLAVQRKSFHMNADAYRLIKRTVATTTETEILAD